MAKPGYTELSESTGISLSYAHEIISNARTPSRALAIHILRKTNWRHPILDGLTPEQIDLLETIERWTPREAAA